MRLFAATALLASAASSVLGAALYLVGDSTMASHGASEGIQGWGVPLANDLTVITLIGRGSVTAQTWRLTDVVIEFGHNDGGSPRTSDRAPVGGEGSETTTVLRVTLADGTVETVYTWPTYIKWMIDGAESKGATPIISSTTPNNPFEGVTKINYTPNRFVTFAKNAAAAKGVPYASLLYYDKLGKAVTESYFPNDHTHTNAAGANAVAWAFLSGLRCPSAKGVLTGFINSAGKGAGARCTAP